MATYLVRYEYPVGGYYDFRMDGNAKLVPHFKLYELAKLDGINKCLTHGDCRDENFLINKFKSYVDIILYNKALNCRFKSL